MFLITSVAVFIVYFSNCALGAFAGSPFLGDVVAMPALFAALILFGVAILKKIADCSKRPAAIRALAPVRSITFLPDFS